MLSLNVIVALTPSLLFFYLRGESLSGPTSLIENPSKFQHLSGTLKNKEKRANGPQKLPKMKPKSTPEAPKTRTFAKL